MKKTAQRHKVRRDRKKQRMIIMTMRVPPRTVATARRTTTKKIMMKTMMRVAMTRMTVMIVMKTMTLPHTAPTIPMATHMNESTTTLTILKIVYSPINRHF